MASEDLGGPERPSNEAGHGAPAKQPQHDLLLIRDDPSGKGARLERFRIDKERGIYQEDGTGDKAPVAPTQEGYRSVMNLGSSGTGTKEDPKRGPILSTLPLHPSPAASSGTTCYLLNAQNLEYTTPWTAEEWNDRPGGYDAAGFVRPDSFSLLIASPAGKVYYLERKADADGVGIPLDQGGFTFSEIDLCHEPEVWTLLRNGCVVGRALYDGKANASSGRDKVVPLVNIDSLTPVESKEKAR